MIYLLLAAGLFMGWSLGTNDAANAFGTANSNSARSMMDNVVDCPAHCLAHVLTKSSMMIFPSSTVGIDVFSESAVNQFV